MVDQNKTQRKTTMFKTAPRRLNNQLHNTIKESLEPITTPAPTQTNGNTFRLVITTQIYENYGSHNWDGTGECPQYWKAKGGNEYHHPLGTANEIIQMGQAGIKLALSSMRAEIEKSDDYWQEYLIDWELIPSNVETYEERETREMLEESWITLEQAEHYRPRII
jgi:hypothetical protein